MLVLSRRIGERIFIGNGITVSVIAVKGKQVRIGIDAPDDVPIRREELAPKRRNFQPSMVLGEPGSPAWFTSRASKPVELVGG